VFAVFAHGHVSVANMACACSVQCIGDLSRPAFRLGAVRWMAALVMFRCGTGNQASGGPGASWGAVSGFDCAENLPVMMILPVLGFDGRNLGVRIRLERRLRVGPLC